VTAPENKQLLQSIFAELAKGNSTPLLDSMADDFTWIITGNTRWSRRYEGKQTVLKDLFGPLRARLVLPIIVVAHRIIADGDCVVVEARGKNTTRDGIPYNNTYCYVFTLANGKLREMTEYFDSELVTSALGDPLSRPPPAS